MECITNTATVSGLIWSEPVFSHHVLDEDFYTFFIYTERLSENADRIPVTVSSRLMIGRPLIPGEQICVRGQFRSYNAITENGSSHLVLTLFAKELLLDPPASENPNYIYLNGFICRPPVFRRTPFGREITDILLAVNRAFNKSDYIPTIIWGKNARATADLPVGTHIALEGRIQSRDYRKKAADGSITTHTAFEVSVGRFEIIESDV